MNKKLLNFSKNLIISVGLVVIVMLLYFTTSVYAVGTTKTLGELMRSSISDWYRFIRTSCISIYTIIYLIMVIKMLADRTPEKLKIVKESILRFIIMFGLLYFLHYIMIMIIKINDEGLAIAKKFGSTISGINMKTDENDLYETALSKSYEIALIPGFIGLIMYFFLVFYTYKFVFVYIKRYINIIVLILLAPIIFTISTLKRIIIGVNDNRIKTWVKEFVFNVIIQTFHAIFYAILMGLAFRISDIDQNAIGLVLAVIFLGFIFKIDSFIRKLFNAVGGTTNISSSSFVGRSIDKVGGKINSGLNKVGNKAESLGNKMDNYGKNVKENGFKKATADSFNNSKIYFKEKWDNSLIGKTSNSVKENGLKETLKNDWAETKNDIKNNYNEAREDLGNAIKDKAASIKNKASNMYNNVKSEIKDSESILNGDRVRKNLTADEIVKQMHIMEKAEGIEGIRQKIQKIPKETQKVKENVKEKVNRLPNKIKGFGKYTSNKIRKIYSKVSNKSKEKILEIQKAYDTMITDMEKDYETMKRIPKVIKGLNNKIKERKNKKINLNNLNVDNTMMLVVDNTNINPQDFLEELKNEYGNNNDIDIDVIIFENIGAQAFLSPEFGSSLLGMSVLAENNYEELSEKKMDNLMNYLPYEASFYEEDNDSSLNGNLSNNDENELIDIPDNNKVGTSNFEVYVSDDIQNNSVPEKGKRLFKCRFKNKLGNQKNYRFNRFGNGTVNKITNKLLKKSRQQNIYIYTIMNINNNLVLGRVNVHGNIGNKKSRIFRKNPIISVRQIKLNQKFQIENYRKLVLNTRRIKSANYLANRVLSAKNVIKTGYYKIDNMTPGQIKLRYMIRNRNIYEISQKLVLMKKSIGEQRLKATGIFQKNENVILQFVMTKSGELKEQYVTPDGKIVKPAVDDNGNIIKNKEMKPRDLIFDIFNNNLKILENNLEISGEQKEIFLATVREDLKNNNEDGLKSFISTLNEEGNVNQARYVETALNMYRLFNNNQNIEKDNVPDKVFNLYQLFNNVLQTAEGNLEKEISGEQKDTFIETVREDLKNNNEEGLRSFINTLKEEGNVNQAIYVETALNMHRVFSNNQKTEENNNAESVLYQLYNNILQTAEGNLEKEISGEQKDTFIETVREDLKNNNEEGLRSFINTLKEEGNVNQAQYIETALNMHQIINNNSIMSENKTEKEIAENQKKILFDEVLEDIKDNNGASLINFISTLTEEDNINQAQYLENIFAIYNEMQEVDTSIINKNENTNDDRIEQTIVNLEGNVIKQFINKDNTIDTDNYSIVSNGGQELIQQISETISNENLGLLEESPIEDRVDKFESLLQDIHTQPLLEQLINSNYDEENSEENVLDSIVLESALSSNVSDLRHLHYNENEKAREFVIDNMVQSGIITSTESEDSDLVGNALNVLNNRLDNLVSTDRDVLLDKVAELEYVNIVEQSINENNQEDIKMDINVEDKVNTFSNLLIDLAEEANNQAEQKNDNNNGSFYKETISSTINDVKDAIIDSVVVSGTISKEQDIANKAFEKELKKAEKRWEMMHKDEEKIDVVEVYNKEEQDRKNEKKAKEEKNKKEDNGVKEENYQSRNSKKRDKKEDKADEVVKITLKFYGGVEYQGQSVTLSNRHSIKDFYDKVNKLENADLEKTQERFIQLYGEKLKILQLLPFSFAKCPVEKMDGWAIYVVTKQEEVNENEKNDDSNDDKISATIEELINKYFSELKEIFIKFLEKNDSINSFDDLYRNKDELKELIKTVRMLLFRRGESDSQYKSEAIIKNLYKDNRFKSIMKENVKYKNAKRLAKEKVEQAQRKMETRSKDSVEKSINSSITEEETQKLKKDAKEKFAKEVWEETIKEEQTVVMVDPRLQSLLDQIKDGYEYIETDSDKKKRRNYRKMPL